MCTELKTKINNKICFEGSLEFDSYFLPRSACKTLEAVVASSCNLSFKVPKVGVLL